MALIRKNLSEESIKNLRCLQGEFRLTRSRVRAMRTWSILQIALGGLCIWILFQRSQALPPSFRMFSHEGIRIISAGVYGVVLLVGGTWLWHTAGRGYRFGSGLVQGLSNSGAVLWTEDVLGIVSGTISHDYGGKVAFMTLQWANAKRRIDIDPSLAEALKALEPVPASEPLDLRAVVESRIRGPALEMQSVWGGQSGKFRAVLEMSGGAPVALVFNSDICVVW
jgi:hypothetical protein